MLEGNQQALLQMMRDTKIAVNDIITIQQERDRKQREQDEQVGRGQNYDSCHNTSINSIIYCVYINVCIVL